MWPTQGHRRTFVLTAAVLIVIVLALSFSPPKVFSRPFSNDHSPSDNLIHGPPQEHQRPDVPDTDDKVSFENRPSASEEEQEQEALAQVAATEHITISSKLTKDGYGFRVDFRDYEGYNPNMIPHPHKENTWIVVAQSGKIDGQDSLYSMELVCDAVFTEGKMQCVKSPLILPIQATTSPRCEGKLDMFNTMVGPHDARVFLAPEGIPYIVYGSPSQYSCLGQWIQDLRRMTIWDRLTAPDQTQLFFLPTDMERPPPHNKLEKNWFVFWDHAGDIYVHYDIAPKRVFAKMKPDGTIDRDLAPLAAANDDACMQQNMPKIRSTGGNEHIHQATNSLAVTLCRRSDLSCQQTDQNTYVFSIFHHKLSYSYDTYEPYVMLFNQKAPFELHGISSKPIWIKGRGNWTDDSVTPEHPHMIYVTSMSWRRHGLNYHGYLDDELILAFGVDDLQSGGIEVMAEDLVRDLGLCK